MKPETIRDYTIEKTIDIFDSQTARRITQAGIVIAIVVLCCLAIYHRFGG